MCEEHLELLKEQAVSITEFPHFPVLMLLGADGCYCCASPADHLHDHIRSQLMMSLRAVFP